MLKWEGVILNTEVIYVIQFETSQICHVSVLVKNVVKGHWSGY